MTDPTEDLARLVRSGLIDTYFTPVVDLFTGDPGGYMIQHVSAELEDVGPAEAARLRRSVRQSPLVGDFDSSLRAAALRAAGSAGLPTHTRLFMTAEPESLALVEDRTDEPDRSVILQLDPERIRSSPAAVLRSMRQARSLGWGIGVKSIGADLSTTAFLPLINPSVVSLHEDVLRITDLDHLAELIRLLHAHTERTGAVILAEGVADDDDLEVVEAIGARFVTGPRYGRPAKDPDPVATPWEDPLADHFTRNLTVQGTPFSIANGLKRDPLVMGEELLAAELASLQRRALSSGESTVVVGVFEEDEALDAATEAAFTRLLDTAGFTAVLSGGFDESPLVGARTGALDGSDPLRSERAVIVVGPDWSGLVAARRRADPGSDGRTLYSVHVTTERYTCVDAARSTMTRLRPLG